MQDHQTHSSVNFITPVYVTETIESLRPRPSARSESNTSEGFQIHCDFSTLKTLYKNERDRGRGLEDTLGSLKSQAEQLLAEKEHLAAHYEEVIARLHDLKELDSKVESLQAEKGRKAEELRGLSEAIHRLKAKQEPLKPSSKSNVASSGTGAQYSGTENKISVPANKGVVTHQFNAFRQADYL